MKSIIISMIAAAGLMVAGSALAVDMPADGKAKCGACHAIDHKVVGPAWNDVAAKYKGDTDAASKIAANVTKGGSFGWKLGSMPAKGMGASDEQVKSLAAFIAGLASDALKAVPAVTAAKVSPAPVPAKAEVVVPASAAPAAPAKAETAAPAAKEEAVKPAKKGHKKHKHKKEKKEEAAAK